MISKLLFLKPLFTIVLLLLCEFCAEAQDCQVKWSGEQISISSFQGLLDARLSCDSLTSVRSLNKAVSGLQEDGYLQASYALNVNQDLVSVNCHLGNRYKWVKLNTANLPAVFLAKSGFSERDFTNQVFSVSRLSRFMKKLITVSENEGLPFASVYLDSVEINANEIAGILRYDPGPRITFDSLLLPPKLKTKRVWLETYLGIKQGNPFSQKIIDDIEGKISRLSFLKLEETPKVSFQNKQATLSLILSEKKTSSVDGIVGFLPNEERDGRLLITGQFDLFLQNLFRSGKSLAVEWQSLKARSQLLDLRYRHPNLLRSVIDFEGHFRLLKEDTLFITRQADLNFSYQSGRSKFTVFSNFYSSGILGEGTDRNAGMLPEIADIRIGSYGLAYDYFKLDRPINPMRGFYFKTDLAVGSKRIEKNSNLPDELYDDIDLSSAQYTINVSAGSYLKLNKSLVLHNHFEMGTLINERVFLNDLRRIGGLNSLRGFNENFFFAQDFINATLELQLHFQQDSYLFVFYDQAYLYYDIEISRYEDYPLGVGLGLNLATSSGAVSLAYALGRSDEQSLSLNLSKFHFGYVARF